MLILQKLFVQCRSRRNNFNNLALYNAFGELRILHLLANSDTIAFFYQLDVQIDAAQTWLVKGKAVD